MLIFDSGIGGISILNKIKKILPNINYIYMLDNAAFPYGEKKESFILNRSIKIINTIQKIYPIKIVIIACNTASTTSLSILQKTFNIPIIGVLPFLEKSIKINKNSNIGFIATKATINSKYIKNIIYKNFYKKNINIIATNKLAKFAEKKIRKQPISIIKFKKIFKSWIRLSIQPNIIYLGCTHFLFLKNEIQKIFYTPINFLDSHDTVINIVKHHFLKHKNNQNIKKNIFLYSKYNKEINQLLSILTQYKFNYIHKINLN
ncbi:Glutamate racemase [Buchnera aphidicola (Protaphis terricola)]|uniref:glutamate racemase n=1 Tax=Buchnera aphidicola TaxID=9 RepID=UPI00346390B1